MSTTSETERQKTSTPEQAEQPNTGMGTNAATTETEPQKTSTPELAEQPNTGMGTNAATTDTEGQKTSTPEQAEQPNTGMGTNATTTETEQQKTSTPEQAEQTNTGMGTNAATTETERQKTSTPEQAEQPKTGMGTTADSTKQQHTITDRNLTFLTSDDDDAIVKQIQETHVKDPKDEVAMDVKPLLRIIVDILPHATSSTPGNIQAIKAQLDALNSRLDEAITLVNEMPKLQQEHIMREIYCQISCKCSGGADAHATTVALFKTLSCYSWHAKVVIALAVFAINYGKFWPVVQLYPNIPLDKSVAIIEQLLDDIANLTRCIVELELLSVPATATTHQILTAVYWTIRSIVACPSQVMGLMGMGHEYIPSIMEARELSTLTRKVSNIKSELTTQMIISRQQEANKKLEDLIKAEPPLRHNWEILKAFIIVEKEEKMLLFHGSNKDGVSIDVLRKKNVLLLISDLDFSDMHLSALIQLYEKSARMRYDIVWLPVIDRSTTWNDVKQKQFETLRGLMPWYSVYHPSMLVIKYVTKVFEFRKDPLIVMVDSSGKVGKARDIQTIIRRWETLDFMSFTEWEEENTWNEVTWFMNLLIETFSAEISAWISQEKYIFIYGGEDIEWIKTFTTTARKLSRDAKIKLEMLYVGKSDPGEKVGENIAIIIKEQLSHTVLELSQIKFFWVRLRSIGYPGEKLSQRVDSDPVLQEIRAVVSFDTSDQCWAIISRKRGEIAAAKGDTIMKSISHYNQWEDSKNKNGFMPALKEHLQSVEKKKVCGECGHQISETK